MKDTPKKFQEEFRQEFLLEFSPEIMANSTMTLVEEGRIEFILPHQVSLKKLTENCKQQLAKKLHLEVKSELYNLLFS